MKYLALVESASADPAGLENLYRQALSENGASEFERDLLALYAEHPENLLLAAWYFRLQEPHAATRAIHWKLAVPLAILSGLLIWLTSNESKLFVNRFPYLFLTWAPIAAIAVLAFLSLASRQRMRQALLLGFGLLAALLYVVLVVPTVSSRWQGYVADLMGLHLPLLAWSAIGLYLAGFRNNPPQRFAFLVKSLEVFTVSGLSLIAGVIFAAVSFSLFQALQVEVPEPVARLVIAGGAGLVPVLAVALVYNPLQSPARQEFRQGVSRFLSSLLRILIIPTLVVAVIYVLFIPFNFTAPFQDRDVLFAYNAMLFAVMGLLLGATPLQPEDLSPRLQIWLRRAILAVAALAVLVSLYAMAAILYRTVLGGLTANRLAVICWNIVNTITLVMLILRQSVLSTASQAQENWVASLKTAFAIGAGGYIACSITLTLALPLLFR